MARQSNLHYEGTVGNIIYYKRNGKYFMRTKPAAVKQSKKSRQASGHFGQAAKLGTPLRKAFAPLYPAGENRPLMYRLNSALQNWVQNKPGGLAGIHSIPELKDFQLNIATTFSERFRPKLVVSDTGNGLLTVSLPAYSCKKEIAAPAGTSQVHLQFIAVSVSMENNCIDSTAEQHINLPYNNETVPAAGYEFPIPAMPGHMRVLAVSIRYTVNRKLADKSEWCPGCILYADWNR